MRRTRSSKSDVVDERFSRRIGQRDVPLLTSTENAVELNSRLGHVARQSFVEMSAEEKKEERIGNEKIARLHHQKVKKRLDA